MQVSKRIALPAAILLSFLVYLVPLLSVHAGWMPVGLIFAGLADPSFLSLAMMAGAIVLQCILILLFYWLLREFRWWKGLVLAAATPPFLFVANWGLLYAIPFLILIEADKQPEIGDLELVCSVPDATLAQVHSGAELSLEKAGEAWVILQAGGARARLTMPDCRVEPVESGEVRSTIDHVAPGGYLLYRAGDGGMVYVRPDREELTRLSAPPDRRYWDPILSDDGSTVVWLDRAPTATGTRPHRLHLRNLVDSREEVIRLDIPAEGQFDLIGADTTNDRFTLARYRNEILVVDRQGRTVVPALSPSGIYNARWGFRWVDDGWVAWDGYREEGHSRIVWDLHGRKGQVSVPRGRRIDWLSVDPRGRIIAVSVSGNLNLGGTDSAVFLLSTDSGTEIYRRYFPPYSRHGLAFLGGDYLAATRWGDGQSFIDVYRVPSSGDG